MSATPAGERIGLFGGSFDPIHDAHLALARLALAALRLDRLLWVPVGEAWQKNRRLAPAADREAMVALAIAGEPRFALSRIETTRPGPSYTVDTVRALRAQHPGAEWFLVIGADQQAGFHTWHGWRELLDTVTLAVAGRTAHTGPPRALDPVVAAHPHIALPLPPMAVSSTEIRARVAAGLPIDASVAPEVARYIARHRLYADAPGDPPPPPRS